MVSNFSIIMAIILFNASLPVIAMLRRKTNFLVRYSTNALILLSLLSAIRLALPLDFAMSRVVSSYAVVPAIIDGLNTAISPATPRITVAVTIMAIWLAGSLFVIAKTARSIFKGWVARKGWRKIPCPREKSLLREAGARNVRLTVSPDIAFPMVTGLFIPHIYLPPLTLSDKKLSMVLQHELQHIKLKDTWIKLFYLSLSAVFWWNPIVHKFQRELDNLLELRCDVMTTRRMDPQMRIEYFEVILDVIRQSIKQGEPTAALATAFAKESPEAFLRQRMTLVLSQAPAGAWWSQALATGLVVCIFVASFFVIIQPAYAPPDSTDSLQVFTLSKDNAYVRVVDGVYKVYVNGEYFMDITQEQLDLKFSDLDIITEDK